MKYKHELGKDDIDTGVLTKGWFADHEGNCTVHYPDALTGKEAAELFVDNGE